MDTKSKRKMIAQAKELIAELEASIDADVKGEVKPWEPPPGEWWIGGSGEVHRALSTEESRLFGTERHKKALALRAVKKMRRFNVLLAYIDKYAPDYEPDWSNENEPKFCPRYNHQTGKWVRSVGYRFEGVNPYGPFDVIDGLIEKLNRGEVVLWHD